VCTRAHDIDLSDPLPTTGNMTMGGRLAQVPRDRWHNDPGFRAAEAACRHRLPAREKQRQK
jgi:hypothetical protein